jgi:hypothetical protein
VCPTEEDMGMIMSSVVVEFTCVGGKGRKKGLKMGAATLDHEASKGRAWQLRTKSHHFKQEGYSSHLLFMNTTHAIIFYVPYCVLKNTFSPLQVKKKPCDEELEHAFILS